MTTSQKPKYQLIVLELRESIQSGEYKEGERLPSEADLVKRFSTSRLTVQRALKELQHQALIERRAGSGTYVRRNESADHYVFGLLIPGLGETEIFEPICQGMARAGREGGHALLWGDTTHSSAELESDREQQIRDLCRYYIDRKVTGIFFAPLELTPSMDCVNQWVVDTLSKANLPCVLLDRCVYRYPRRCSFDMIGIDNRRAGFITCEHLLRHGCRRVLFFAKPYSAYTVDTRISGFHDAVQTFNVAGARGYVHIGNPSELETIRATLEAYRPDGVVCANDITAAQLMQTLEQIGLRIPEDIRIVGVDDVKYAGLLGVPLTTLHQPCREIGETAVRTMLERIANPTLPARDVLLDCKLVIRRSCGSHLRQAQDN